MKHFRSVAGTYATLQQYCEILLLLSLGIDSCSYGPVCSKVQKVHGASEVWFLLVRMPVGPLEMKMLERRKDLVSEQNMGLLGCRSTLSIAPLNK